MIYELKPNQYNLIDKLLNDVRDEHKTVISSVIKGNTKGRVFVNDFINPTTALVWATYLMYYFLGDEKGFEDDQLLYFFKNDLTQYNQEMGCTTFLATLLTHAWSEKMFNLFKQTDYEKGYRQSYTFDIEKYQSLHNVHVHEMTKETFEDEILGEMQENILEFWPSIEAFLHKGKGVYYEKDGQPLAICISCAVSDLFHEIVIETYDESNWGKGYGNSVGNGFINLCINDYLTPVWNAYQTNTGSTKLAEKLGFTPIEKQIYIELLFKNIK